MTAASNGSGFKESLTPKMFKVEAILGKGAFGEVYLATLKKNNMKYAMKVLNKREIMKQNIMKYAQTERNVLCSIKHPFIVGLNYAF